MSVNRAGVNDSSLKSISNFFLKTDASFYQATNITHKNDCLQNTRFQKNENKNQIDIELMQIFMTAADGMRVIDMNYNVTRVNDTFCELTGVNMEESLGKKCYEVFYGSMCHTKECPIPVLCSGKNRIECDVIKYSKNGDEIPCILTATPLPDPQGNIIGIVEDFKDMRERNRFYEKIQQQQYLINAVLNATPELIALKDTNHIYRLANPAFYDFFNIKQKDVSGLTDFDLFPKEKALKYRIHDTETINSLTKHISDEKMNNIWFQTIRTPVINDKKKCTGVLYSFYDISHRKMLELKLIDLNKSLEVSVDNRTKELKNTNKKLQKEVNERKQTEKALKKSEKELRYLSKELLKRIEKERKHIAMELHDVIGRSLTAIKFKIESIISIKDNTDLKTQLLQTINLIKQAIEDVRDISVNLCPSILNDLGIVATISWFCREFEKIYPWIFTEKSINMIEKQIPEEIKIVIFRVMQEAMNNIAKHCYCDTIMIRLNKDNEKIVFEVEDTGNGFDVKAQLNKKGYNKGFGLVSMKERIELSGGTFKIISRIGSGTIIHGSWPLFREYLS